LNFKTNDMKKQEKAEALRLVNQYLPFVSHWDAFADMSRDEKSILHDAKSVAIMNVNEILNSHHKVETDWSIIDFYEEVKFQIGIL